MRRCLLFFLCLFMLGTSAAESSSTLVLRSSAFTEGEYLPDRFAYDNENISPPLSWRDAPPRVASFIVIMDDPDAPLGVWDHWVLYNIPAHARGLPSGVPKEGLLTDGSMQGRNSFGRIGYDGPSPPPGAAHRYVITVYALDTILDVKPGLNKKEVLEAAEGHILDSAKLTGLYKRIK